ncbi:MAG: transglutaminase domain-containing protein [Methyloprofundus sp.]|nr:transglutaminase domain-containing protein [Methyloprofundus sp.]MDT8425642.1 transglutaminase domain-containing protein [Methyloprofundus sp.]
MKLKVILLSFGLFFLGEESSLANGQQGHITIKVDLKVPETPQSAKIWLPYPVSGEYQLIENMAIKGNFVNSGVYKEPKSGALYFYAQWPKEAQEKKLEMGFKVSTQQRQATNLLDTGAPVPVEIQQYLQPDGWIPTDGEVAEIAQSIQKDKTGILEKARAVYDWVVENTARDPNVKGCGLGVVEVTLSKRSGKCADISSVYVALARNVGVPAREVFGLRLGKEAEQDITGGYHCWAEFYLPGTGWVAVDPADVRKKMLLDKLELADIKELREYFFGAVDAYRMTLETGGRGITLQPAQEAKPLNYLMYPYAEVNGKALDYFDPESFHYSVQFKPL